MHSTAAMNAGDGPLSYARNSSYQGRVIDLAKPIMEEEIATKLDIFKTSNPNNTISIADFGCSTGHNSFPVMQIITQAISKKHQQLFNKTPKFFLLFNDVVSNDFNTLFSSLPPDSGNFYAAGVPGDFHSRLFPERSLHFGYSSWSLHWLSQVPDNGNPTWNKGKIFYTEDRKEIYDAYLEQFSKDIEVFLEARAAEIVSGGLMTILIAGVPPLYVSSDITLLGSCLMDLAKKGKFKESMVDSFNLQHYFPSQQELKNILKKSTTECSFTVERFEILDNPGKYIFRSVDERAIFFRAIHESSLKNHFGSEIDVDELFNLYREKLAASPALLDPEDDKSFMILTILKRNSFQ